MLPGIIILRVGAPMYFANVNWVRSRIQGVITKAEAHASSGAALPCEYLIMDLSPVTHLDVTGQSATPMLLDE